MTDILLTLPADITVLRPGGSRPLDLRPFFKRTDIAAFTHDLAPVAGTGDPLSPVAPYWAWRKREKGGLERIMDHAELPDRAARGLAALAGSLRDLAPFRFAGQEMDAEVNTLFRVFYYPSCTIVAWAETGQAEFILANSEPGEEDAEGAFSLPHMLGTIYVEPPGSAHERLALLEGLERDWRRHVGYLNHIASTFQVASGALPEIDFSRPLR